MPPLMMRDKATDLVPDEEQKVEESAEPQELNINEAIEYKQQ